MVLFPAFAVLATAVLGQVANAAPVEAVGLPPAVEAAPVPAGGIPNTLVPSPVLMARAEDSLSKRAISEFQFWKETHFRGEYVMVPFPSGTCYTFTGTWDHWNKAISSVNMISGGPCWLYEGVRCDVSSLGPITYGSPIAELGKFGWDNRAGSVRCE